MPLNVEQLALALAPTLTRIYLRQTGAAWAAAGDTLALDAAFDVDNPFIQGVLGTIADLAKGIAETTRDDIRLLVGTAADEGWSVERLAEAIREKALIASATRAEMIAVTETARAYSLGSKAAYQASGVVEAMEWLTAPDCCEDVCAPLNGKRVALDGAFADGITEPPAHPRCRCTLLPVVRT